MKYLLNTIYFVILAFALPWVAVLRVASGKSLRSWPAKFFGLLPEFPEHENRIWFHAVSVGEVNLLGTVIQRFRESRPDAKVCLSVTTDTGFELAKSKFKDCDVFYFPWDFSWAIQRVIRTLQPRCLVLAELEIWPNLMGIADRQELPVVVVNARLSEKSFRGYRRFSWLTRPLFCRIQQVAAQNETYAKRFYELGVPSNRISVTGSVKFDGAHLDRNTDRTIEFRKLTNITDGDAIFMAGSTQEGEDATVIEAFKLASQSYPNLRLIIAPRHPNRASQIASLVKAASLEPAFRSKLNAPLDSKQVLIVDTIGELSDWWGVADIAFVGGSLGDRGGQNMIEPAAKGCAICFGPNTRNFKQVVELFLKHEIATVVRNENEISDLIVQTLNSSGQTANKREKARQLIISQQGATDKTVAIISSILKSTPSARRDQKPMAA